MKWHEIAKSATAVLCACLLLSGCRGSAPTESTAPPDVSTAPSETWQTVSPEQRNLFCNDQYQYGKCREYYYGPYGIVDREGNVLISPTYEGLYQMANDRFYAFPGGGVGILVDQNGNVLIPDTVEDLQCNIDQSTAEDMQGKPVRFCADGQLYDADGGKIGELYEKMTFPRDGNTVLAKNSEGFFELDLDGRRLRRLDEVQTVDTVFDGALQLTMKPDIDWKKYGARNKEGKQLLEEKYKDVLFLSPDRVIGFDTVGWEDVGYPDREVLIVDSEGKIVCDRYNYILLLNGALMTTSIQVYPYPYLVASIGKATDEVTEDEIGWYLIDHDGNPVNETPFVDHSQINGELVSFIDANNLTVTWSLKTGKMVE